MKKITQNSEKSVPESGVKERADRREYMKTYQASPEGKEHCREATKRWQSKNREHLSEYYREWYEKNKDARNERRREQRKARKLADAEKKGNTK